MKHKAGVAAIAPSPSPIFVFLSYIAERPIPLPNFLIVALVKYLLKGEERVRDDGMLIMALYFEIKYRNHRAAVLLSGSYNGFIDSIHPNSIVAREVLVAPSKSMAATEGYSITPVKTHPVNEGSFDFCARMILRKTPR